MDPKALDPYGAALLAYFQGRPDATLIIRRDDGQQGRLSVSHFFRQPASFTSLEETAIDNCRGHVLDVGAGTGLHSLELQERGLRVTAIDLSSQATEIMSRRGVFDAHCADVFSYRAGPFDTMLMLGHGIGIVETLAGLDRLLLHAKELLSEQGQVLLDSLDASVTDDAQNLAYHDANRRAGRYIGETRLQFEHCGTRGPHCGWLHVDAATLAKRAERAGWSCEVIVEEANGEYLARLTP